MFDYAQFRLLLRKIENTRERVDKAYKKDLEAARKRKAPREEIAKIEDNARYEDGMCRDEVHMAHTSYLLKRANRLVIPIDFTEAECWEDSPVYGTRYLTRQGINELRGRIRSEQRARTERFLMWMPAISGVTGIIGALTGFVAVWWKLKGP